MINLFSSQNGRVQYRQMSALVEMSELLKFETCWYEGQGRSH